MGLNAQKGEEKICPKINSFHTPKLFLISSRKTKNNNDPWRIKNQQHNLTRLI